MGILSFFKGGKEEVKEDYLPTLSFSNNVSSINEQFKGEVEKKDIKFPTELGEEHPFDFKTLEELYKKFGFFTAVVDKYVDFVVGPGFYIECEDERAKEIIEQFMQDVNFDTLLRAWTKEALVKGNGFLEIGGDEKKGIAGIKVLDAKYMYVIRDNKGKILGFNQYKGAFKQFDKQKVIPFKPKEICHIPFNKVGDCAYGMGIGYSSLKDVDNLLSMEKDEHWLIKRKANAPIHAQLGKVEGDIKIIPKPADVTAFGKNLENLSNKTEWATDPLVNFKVIDFGNVGEKFSSVLQHDMAKLMYDYQIPPELMGMANIPEGMAKVRMDGFQRRIQSIQAELEKVIEENIFKRILNANGFSKDGKGKDVHVEFQWGEPSSMALESRTNLVSDLVKSIGISPALKSLLEDELVNLMNLNKDEYQKLKDEQEKIEKENELTRPQPIVPGQQQKFPQKPQPKKEQPKQPTESLKKNLTIGEFVKKVGKEWCVFSHQTGKNFGCYPSEVQAKKRLAQIHAFSKEKYKHIESCPHCTEKWDEVDKIDEWLGFAYGKFVSYILKTVKKDEFKNLKALNDIEESAGYLNEKQINSLKDVMVEGFEKGYGIKQITKNIKKEVKVKDLYQMTEDGKLKLGVSGFPILQVSADKRDLNIARTEITRLANEGAVDYYKANGLTKIKHIASWGDRTCPICEDLDGAIYEIGSEPGLPVHPMCRCSYAPFVELK